jgi:hypothetical protein
MDPLLVIARYLLDRARCRASAARSGHPESGALTLEWIVIAAILVAAATAAAVFFDKAVRSESAKLP